MIKLVLDRKVSWSKNLGTFLGKYSWTDSLNLLILLPLCCFISSLLDLWMAVEMEEWANMKLWRTLKILWLSRVTLMFREKWKWNSWKVRKWKWLSCTKCFGGVIKRPWCRIEMNHTIHNFIRTIGLCIYLFTFTNPLYRRMVNLSPKNRRLVDPWVGGLGVSVAMNFLSEDSSTKQKWAASCSPY